MKLTLWLGISATCVVLGNAAIGCGGATSGGSARGDLEQNGGAHCAAACDTIDRCRVDDDCVCACDCPADLPDCCDTCECSSPSPTECLTGCHQEVADVLESAPGCEDELLALLRCFDGAACGSDPCEPEQEALRDCQEQADDDDVVAGGSGSGEDGEEGTPGMPLALRRLSCSGGSVGSGQGEQGESTCSRGWGSCSDGNGYDVECTTWPSGSQECRCFINGTDVGAAAGVDLCAAPDEITLAACGWTLQ